MSFRGVISRADWGARAPLGYNGEQHIDDGLIVHWEGPGMGWPFPHEHCYDLVRAIQNYHMDQAGYWDIAYNDIACPHGYIFSARSGIPMKNAASGTDRANDYAYAVCGLWGEGDDADAPQGGDQAPQDMKDAIEWVRGQLLAQGAGAGSRGHRDVYPTSCPGDDLWAFAHALGDTGSPTPPVQVPGGGEIVPPVPAPGVPPWPGRFLFNTGNPDTYIAGQDVAAWQQRMADRGWNIVVDGVYGPASAGIASQFQGEKGLVVDGIVGPITWEAAWTFPVTP